MSDFDPSYVPNGASLYLHVPFCSAICDFCAFAKALPSPGDWDRYRGSFETEWSSINFEGKVRSVFWGGGTPGLLKAVDIGRIGSKFRSVLEPDGEWTVELTPLCPTAEKLVAWRGVGVNRISLGVQSFSPRLLEAMGRPYSTEKIPRIVDKIREAGFTNLNLDLIIAFPGQTMEELLTDLQKVVDLNPEHLSVYCLTLEEDTALYTRLTKSGHRQDIDHEANLYETAWRFLGENGYQQYEISNFAREGFECEHHLNVWRLGNWRGIGPSAASQLGEYRFSNPHELSGWSEFVSDPNKGEYPGLERICGDWRTLERIAFGLRMNEGVPRECLHALSPERGRSMEAFLNRIEEEGYLRSENERISLSFPGRLVADEISRWILS